MAMKPQTMRLFEQAHELLHKASKILDEAYEKHLKALASKKAA